MQVPRLFVEVIVRNRCCASVSVSVSCGWRGCVEPGHQFAVGGAGGGEVLVAFFELQPEVDDLLFEVDDALLKLVDVGGGAESGCAPGLFAEQFGQAFLELVDAGGHAGGALLGGEQVGLQ